MKKAVLLWTASAAVALTGSLLWARSGGAPAGSTGGDFPGERTCARAGCHSGTPNSGPGNVAIQFNGVAAEEYVYTPGETIAVLVTVQDPNMAIAGFEVTARQQDGCAQAGDFGVSDSDSALRVQAVGLAACGGVQAQRMTHAFPKEPTSGAVSFEVLWTPPATATGPVRFAAAGNAANGNGSPSGDAIYTTEVMVQPGASNAPMISSGGVVDAAGFQRKLAPGQLASIFGGGLATEEAFAGSVPLPTELANAQVTVNGVVSPMLFARGDQINFQVPYEVALGDPVDVQVTREGQLSAVETVAYSEFAPGIFGFDDVSGARRPVVTRHPNNELITEANPAMPSDILIIWVTGVGAVMDAPASGEAAQGGELFMGTPAATVAGETVSVVGAALTGGFVGLAQVNIQLPDTLPAGSEAELVVSIDGNDSQTAMLPIAGQ